MTKENTESLFVCPNCGGKTEFLGNTLKCERGHSFDVSKSGYVNLLLPNKKHAALPGDTKAMLSSRKRVMESGYYDALISAIVKEIKAINSAPLVLDSGTGVGNVAGALKIGLPKATVYGIDVSKAAADFAAKEYKNVKFAAASGRELPFKDGTFDVVIAALAPAFKEEFRRVLKKDGVFIWVTPNASHLWGLKTALYEKPRENEIDEGFLDGFAKRKEFSAVAEYTASGENVKNLIEMTPYYFNTPKEAVSRVSALPSLTTVTDFLIRIYRKEQ